MAALIVQEKRNKVLVLNEIIHTTPSQSGILKKKDCSGGKSTQC